MDKKKVYIVTNHDNNYSTAIRLSEEQAKAIQWFIDLDDVNYSVCLPEDCCCEEIQKQNFQFIWLLEGEYLSVKKEYKVMTHTVTENVLVKETRICNVCNKEIEKGKAYWVLTTHHYDWGNDS